MSPGTTYYWQVVSRTIAQRAAAGPVLSPGTYLTKPPGPAKNDTTIVPK